MPPASTEPTLELQRSLFKLHRFVAPRDEVQGMIARLLDEVNRRWQRRRLLAIGAAALTCAVAVFCFFDGRDIAFLLTALLIIPIARFGRQRSQSLEVEVETLVLARDLIARLTAQLDPRAPLEVALDLRSVFAKQQDRPGGANLPTNQPRPRKDIMRDHWLTMSLPLADGHALELDLSEHIHATTAFALASQGSSHRRIGRDYSVALYRDHRCLEASLAEAVVSHISAPSGSTLESRVKEGVEVFLAAFNRLRSDHAHPHAPAHAHRGLSRSGLLPFDPATLGAHDDERLDAAAAHRSRTSIPAPPRGEG